MDRDKHLMWLEWAKELQFIAQAGLTYSKDPFDRERFERIRELSAEMMSLQNGLPLEQVKGLFCNETGFQTPKLDTRAAIFKEGKILLVKERNETWSLPGGWVDVMQTIRSNTIKEVKEEAGLDVEAVRIIALHDRNLHNPPPMPTTYARSLCSERQREAASGPIPKRRKAATSGPMNFHYWQKKRTPQSKSGCVSPLMPIPTGRQSLTKPTRNSPACLIEPDNRFFEPPTRRFEQARTSFHKAKTAGRRLTSTSPPPHSRQIIPDTRSVSAKFH